MHIHIYIHTFIYMDSVNIHTSIIAGNSWNLLIMNT